MASPIVPIAHPIAQRPNHVCSTGAEGLDAFNLLNWFDLTAQDSMDEATRSPKVATLVRVPFGLQNRQYQFSGQS